MAIRAFSWLLAVSAASAALLDKRVPCNGNNCLNAVRRAGGTSTRGVADCSSFFATSTQPVTITVSATTSVPTSTVTVTQYSVVGGSVLAPRSDLQRRDEIELAQRALSSKTIPAYASSACGGDVARYSSACWCAAMPTPTTTTSTTVATVTATVAYATTYSVIPVCGPQDLTNKYNSASWSKPDNSIDDDVYVSGVTTAKDCCVACFQAKGCEYYDWRKYYNPDYLGCSLKKITYGPVVDQYNPTCPSGKGFLALSTPSGTEYGLAAGPCSKPFPPR
ncbi:MAG: hypothetical protein Q9214_000983 [Letrouitia sp. 1 TL-2023]